jgi:L-malate glycosyltransferase
LRLLFCLPTTALSGGVKVIFELANRLIDAGESVDIFSFAQRPKWFSLKATLIDDNEIETVDMAAYDFVLVCNAFMLPLILAHSASCRCILFCQDYESFHHAQGKTLRDFVSDEPTFTQIYKLPVPLIASSQAVQTLLRERVGRDAYYLPIGIDKTVFFPRPRKSPTEIKRVLLVGNYLMPYKGMRDGFEALRMLCTEMPVQLVLVTQESRGRAIFNDLPYPIELHFCPTDDKMPEIIAGCDLYCCTSWYEGLGLPALEAFCCGVPVISTRTYGVSDYGIDGVNLLLAQPNDPQDIRDKLRQLLLDGSLAERLRHAAFKTVAKKYDWSRSLADIRRILLEIDQTYASVGAIDSNTMQGLLERLEKEGNLTPIAVYRRFQQLSEELDELVYNLLSEVIPMPTTLEKLQSVRDMLGYYLDNKTAEYYDAFKSQYDFCQLLLSLSADARFNEYLNLILVRRKQSEPQAATSFFEIRYSDRKL